MTKTEVKENITKITQILPVHWMNRRMPNTEIRH
jgi:hypothetical protein